MKISKKVEFMERVAKTRLGLGGLQIVVFSDKTSGGRMCNEKDINFEVIGKKCLNEIDGKHVKNKFGIESGIEFGKKLHEERIKWMQENCNY